MFVALGFQHVMRMRSTILSVACLGLSYFSVLSNERNGFQKTRSETEMYVVIFPRQWSETFLILTITERHVIVYVHRSAGTYRLLVQFIN